MAGHGPMAGPPPPPVPAPLAAPAPAALMPRPVPPPPRPSAPAPPSAWGGLDGAIVVGVGGGRARRRQGRCCRGGGGVGGGGGGCGVPASVGCRGGCTSPAARPAAGAPRPLPPSLRHVLPPGLPCPVPPVPLGPRRPCPCPWAPFQPPARVAGPASRPPRPGPLALPPPLAPPPAPGLPVHRCARSVCCVGCAVSWASWLLFTGVLARCVVLRVRCPGPPGSCSPVCPLGALFRVCGVLGHLAPVHRCARSVCCVGCAVSWATWLLFTGVPARCVVLGVRCPGPPGSCSPVCPLGVLFCVCGVLGLLAPVHRCARSVCCLACAVSWATWLLYTNATARALACCGGGMRVPGGGASCLGVGRPGSGALPPPTARPLSGLPGPTTHWPWVRGAAGVGTRHRPDSARSCELALRAVGAA